MQESTFLNPGRVIHAIKLREGMLVVDFGAGSGFFSRAAARIVGQEGRVWAVDVHQDMLARLKNLSAAEGLTNVDIVRGDVEHEGGSQLPPEHFDLVIAANILFSAEDKKTLIKEIRRVLKRGGRALLVDWSGSWGGLGPAEKHVVKPQDARTLCEEAGLTYVEEVPAGRYHWGFLVRKKAPGGS